MVQGLGFTGFRAKNPPPPKKKKTKEKSEFLPYNGNMGITML